LGLPSEIHLLFVKDGPLFDLENPIENISIIKIKLNFILVAPCS